MNKQDMAQAIAQATGLSLKDSAAAIDAIVEAVMKSLKKGERVQLAGFGSWETRKRAARNGINPKTGEKIKIKARTVPKFNPGKELKDVVD
ncbi:MAG: HU family DNA-binding protein [Candidatus Wallbacteria bacterium]|nr:HU family DNA-binding protein [Candidatus Wallbacteria bacterium]MBI4868284.1 HU family DNA-binding protein [Candidatus Wallbacteria bacterium]